MGLHGLQMEVVYDEGLCVEYFRGECEGGKVVGCEGEMVGRYIGGEMRGK